MTAEEIVQKVLLNFGYKIVHIGRPYEVINKQFIHKSEVEKLIELIKDALKEQFELGRESILEAHTHEVQKAFGAGAKAQLKYNKEQLLLMSCTCSKRLNIITEKEDE